MRLVVFVFGNLLSILIYTFLAPIVIPVIVYEKFIRKCPRCGKRGCIHCVELIKATMIKPDGRRYPDHWSYWLCSHCKAKLKKYHGEFIDADEDDWVDRIERPKS